MEWSNLFDWGFQGGDPTLTMQNTKSYLKMPIRRPQHKHWLPQAAYMAYNMWAKKPKYNPREQPMTRRRRRPYRGKRRKAGRKRRFRRKRARGFGERRMKQGGNRLKLRTQIIPKETFVVLPMTINIPMIKPASTTDNHAFIASIRGSLYWPWTNHLGTRIQHMVRGADAWASFYRQYQVTAMKITIQFLRQGSITNQTNLFPILHTGVQDRVGTAGNATFMDFKTQKNTQVGRPMSIISAVSQGASNNGRTGQSFLKKYATQKYFTRTSENQATLSALTGLPGTAGASNTDPAFPWFFNIGLAGDGGVNMADTADNYGQMYVSVKYYVRFFDRKYFARDLLGATDTGTAVAQTGYPNNG